MIDNPPVDIIAEGALSCSAAARKMPEIDGNKINPATIWRWCAKGMKGIRCEHAWIGGRIVTSEAALHRFCNRLGQAKREQESPLTHSSPSTSLRPRTEKMRARDIANAEKVCRKAGMLA